MLIYTLIAVNVVRRKSIVVGVTKSSSSVDVLAELKVVTSTVVIRSLMVGSCVVNFGGGLK